jgi:hypothetical protein
MIIGGTLGIFLHALKTIRDINKKSEYVDFKTVFSIYWKKEKMSFLTSIICYCVVLFLASEFIDFNDIIKPDFSQGLKERIFHFKLSQFIRLTSVFFGYTSSSVVYGWLGVTEKTVLNKISSLYDVDKSTAEIKDDVKQELKKD